MNSFLELAKARYSVRKYKPAAVEQEKIDRILEAARVAPTACNNQPQKIYIIKSEEKRKALAEVCPCTFDAPVIFAVGFDENLAAKGKLRENYNYGETDAAIVCSHMMFEATELGLGSCWVGWFNSDDVKRVLGLPDSVVVCNLLPVGYASESAKPSHLHGERRELSEIAEEI